MNITTLAYFVEGINYNYEDRLWKLLNESNKFKSSFTGEVNSDVSGYTHLKFLPYLVICGASVINAKIGTTETLEVLIDEKDKEVFYDKLLKYI